MVTGNLGFIMMMMMMMMVMATEEGGEEHGKPLRASRVAIGLTHFT